MFSTLTVLLLAFSLITRELYHRTNTETLKSDLSKTDSELQRAQDEVDRLKLSSTSQGGSLLQTYARIDALESQVLTLESELEDVTRDNEALEGQVDALEFELTEAQNLLDELGSIDLPEIILQGLQQALTCKVSQDKLKRLTHDLIESYALRSIDSGDSSESQDLETLTHELIELLMETFELESLEVALNDL